MNIKSGQPLERKVLRYEIKKILTEAILNGEIAPGERIVETRIAKDLQVSQAPVREAICELEQMGLVETQPYRGAFVKAINLEEIVESYKLRSVIEGYAAEVIAEKVNDDIIAQFNILLNEMKKGAEENNRSLFIEMDIAFHELIIKSTGSNLLYRVWSLVNMAYLPYLTFTKSTMSFEDLVQRHEKILEALINKDVQGSRQAVQNHIEELGQKVLTKTKFSR
ncbi:MAG: GntR family transcriptional regulator [Peptococcales bacterium]